MLKIWAARQNADLTEGRGPMVAKSYFLNREDAQEAAYRLDGVMGVGCGDVSEEITVYETFTEWLGHTKPSRRERVREQALKKLTREEREVLGLL